jgi:hypothetical protein
LSGDVLLGSSIVAGAATVVGNGCEPEPEPQRSHRADSQPKCLLLNMDIANLSAPGNRLRCLHARHAGVHPLEVLGDLVR